MKNNGLVKKKGEWGYINSRKLLVSIRTAIMYIAAIGIYIIGIKTCGTYKNIWTIVAILSILPASKSMVNLIMFFRFKSLPKNDYSLLCEHIKDIPAIYELPFTTYERTYFVEAIVCTNNTIIGYRTEDNSKRGNNKTLETHLSEVLTIDNYKNFTVKIFDSRKAFLNRVDEMNNNFSDSNGEYDIGMLATLKSVIL